MEIWLKNENDDLKEKLKSRETVMKNLKLSIDRQKIIRDEYKDCIVGSFHQNGRFLEPNDDTELLRKEIEITNERIRDLNTDIAIISADQTDKNGGDDCSEEENEELESLEEAVDELIKESVDLETDINRVKSERNVLLQSIRNEKAKEETLNEITFTLLTRNNRQKVKVEEERILPNFHDIMSESINLKYKLEEAIANKKHQQNLNKMQEEKLTNNIHNKNNNKKMSYKEAEKSLGHFRLREHVDYLDCLQKMTLALLETYDVKNDVLNNQIKANKTLGNRIASLSNYADIYDESSKLQIPPPKPEVKKVEPGSLSPNIRLRIPKSEDKQELIKYGRAVKM